MDATLQTTLDQVRATLAHAQQYEHAAAVLSFDQETICPAKGMEEQGEVMAFLSNQAFRLLTDENFFAQINTLYARRDELGEWDREMVRLLHREYLKVKNISPEQQYEFSLIYNKAFVDWSEARSRSDFSLFSPTLQKVFDVCRKEVELREDDPEATEKKVIYDYKLDDYERDMTTDVLDDVFARCKDRLMPFLKKIVASKKQIRTDFLSRPVRDEQQHEIAVYLLDLMRYDFTRGALTTSEHPFTNYLGKNDMRVTTHYYPEQFASSMFSAIHEGGHALFGQLQPMENFDHFLSDGKTLGMNESVSRFYENRIGRSREYISLIYPKVCEIFPQVMHDVSEEELYEGFNVVTPSLIRTEADEFTYTIHVIIRYEVEKALFAGEVTVDELPALWNRKYQEYLGVTPTTDREGVLQDVHWTFGFGYFPTYALGNFYNAMYSNRMKEDFSLPDAVAAGDFATINNWMAEHVFQKADRLSPQEWIHDITGRTLTPDDFLDYLENKYGELYGID